MYACDEKISTCEDIPHDSFTRGNSEVLVPSDGVCATLHDLQDKHEIVRNRTIEFICVLVYMHIK